MPTLKEPWRISNNVLKSDEPCIKEKSHRFRMISLTRIDDSDFLPNGHTKSEVIYQCVVCKKYQIDRYAYPKIKRVSV